jgi:TetR/AcrR family transcriptional regulator
MTPRGKASLARREPKLNASAEQLIEATAALLSKRTDLEVSISEIAQVSGFNSALIKYYFGNKEGLLLALLERDAKRLMDGLTHLVEMDLPAQQKLRIHIGAVIKAYFRAPYLNRLIHFMVEHAEPALGQRVAEIFVKPIRAAYKAILDQGIHEGVFRPVDPGLLYFSLVGACDHIFVAGQSVEALTGHAKVTEKLRETYASHVADIFVRGIGTDSAIKARDASEPERVREGRAASRK